MTAVECIYQKIKRSRRYVFERKDFDDVASYDQVGRALRQLVKQGDLIKIGYGLYTKAKLNSLTGKPMPTHPGGTDALMREILKMKGWTWPMLSEGPGAPPVLALRPPRPAKAKALSTPGTSSVTSSTSRTRASFSARLRLPRART